jgi:Fe-S cluster assembly iron-binding protein IscA
MKRLLRSILLATSVVSLLLPLSSVMAIPAGHVFYGTVTLDGSPAPDGTSVTAEMSGYSPFGTTTSGGDYALTINADTADDGKNIDFYVNGIYAASSTFIGLSNTPLDLSATTQYTLTINTSGNGSTTGAGPYDKDTDAPITATPDAGWQFVNWTGDIVADPNSASTIITMDADKTVTANFSPLPTHILTMAVTGNGSTDPPVGDNNYVEGTVVPITATPDAGWQFVNWTGDIVADPNSASTVITMNADKAVTANFTQLPTYTLTMAVNGSGSTDPPVGDNNYVEGTVVNIMATPDAGWQFDSWTGDVADPGSASTTVTMDADKTITANFTQVGGVTYTLTITTNGNGSTTGAGTYAEGTVVNIMATPDAGWQFDSWTGDVADPGSASTTVTMDADKTVTANFVQEGDTTPPDISGISESNVTSTSADIAWTTDESGDSQVAYRASPGWLTSLDETLVTVHLVQLTGLQPGTTYYYKVMSRDGAGNLTISDEMQFTTVEIPASFATGDWAISLAEVEAGKKLTISFAVTNTGGLSGSYRATLTVNEVVEAVREVTIEAGASDEIAFSVTKSDAGTYLVVVDGFIFSFTVTPAGGINWWLLIGIIAGLLLIVAIIILASRFGLTRFKEAVTSTLLSLKGGKEAEEVGEEVLPGQPVDGVAAAVEEIGDVLTVTPAAAERLKEAILAKTADPDLCFRLIPSPTKPSQLKMTLDRQKEGDLVVEKEGVRILVISPEMVPELRGMVIDYQDRPDGGGFTISRPTSEV